MRNLAIFSAFLISLPITLAAKTQGPKGMPINKTTSCKEFGKNARFNPYSVVGDEWFTFYYWANTSPHSYKFRIPSKRDISYLHYLLDHHVKNFNWSANMLLMENQLDKSNSLLVENGDRGQYWHYILMKNMALGQLAQRYSVRLKQTSDNKYLAVVECESHSAYVMSRINEVPPKAKLQEEAAKIGYRGRKGKSYLYQGHEWMPIPEIEEKTFWAQWRTMKSSPTDYKKPY